MTYLHQLVQLEHVDSGQKEVNSLSFSEFQHYNDFCSLELLNKKQSIISNWFLKTNRFVFTNTYFSSGLHLVKERNIDFTLNIILKLSLLILNNNLWVKYIESDFCLKIHGSTNGVQKMLNEDPDI